MSLQKTVSLNGVLGYQRVWKSGFLFDVNAGVSAEKTHYINGTTYDILPKIDLKIGYAF